MHVAAVMTAALLAAPPDLEWKWQRFTPVEGVVTGTALLSTGAIIVFTSEKEPLWTRRLILEDPVRDSVRAETPATRERAAIIGDLTYYGALAYPYLVDVVATAWLGHKSGDVAVQMALINTEAFALTGFLSFLSNAVIRRERPYVRTCEGAEEPTFPSCKLPGKSEGFFSGHTGIAATAAGLTCAHHAYLPLYGNKVADAAACVATIVGTVVTGYTRLVADKHYLYDVLAGVVIGFPIGYGVAAYHYLRPTAKPTSWLVLPTASASSLGLAFSATL